MKDLCVWCQWEIEARGGPALLSLLGRSIKNCARHENNVAAAKSIDWSASVKPSDNKNNLRRSVALVSLIFCGLVATVAAQNPGSESIPGAGDKRQRPGLTTSAAKFPNVSSGGNVGIAADGSGKRAERGPRTPQNPQTLTDPRGGSRGSNLPDRVVTIGSSGAVVLQPTSPIGERPVGCARTNFLDRVVAIESAGDAGAVGDNGYAHGLFQMHRPAWDQVSALRKLRGLRAWGYSFAHDKLISRVYAAEYLTILHGQLSQALRRPPTEAELYAAYNCGFNGFSRRGLSVERAPLTTRKALAKL